MPAVTNNIVLYETQGNFFYPVNGKTPVFPKAWTLPGGPCGRPWSPASAGRRIYLKLLYFRGIGQ